MPHLNLLRLLSGLQILRMNNERFAVPELLFHPSDVGKK